jgi:hypothetical protein
MEEEHEMQEVNEETNDSNFFMNQEQEPEETMDELFIPSTQEPSPIEQIEKPPKYTTFIKLLALSSFFICLFLTSIVFIGLEIFFKTQIPQEGYKVSNLRQTANGIEADLNYITFSGESNSPYGDDIPNLFLQIFYETKNRIHIKITDKENPNRWEGHK